MLRELRRDNRAYYLGKTCVDRWFISTEPLSESEGVQDKLAANCKLVASLSKF